MRYLKTINKSQQLIFQQIFNQLDFFSIILKPFKLIVKTKLDLIQHKKKRYNNLMQNKKSYFRFQYSLSKLQSDFNQMTQSSTPQDFIFLSSNFNNRQLDTKFKQKTELQTQENQITNNSQKSQKYNSYHSFTDLMQHQIKGLIEAQYKQEENTMRDFKQFLNRYQKCFNKYFQICFKTDFSANSLKIIFGPQSLSFGQTIIDEIIQNSQILEREQKRTLIQLLIKNQKIYKFLSILLKKLPNQLSQQFIIITYQLFKFIQQNNPIDFQQLSQILFYDYRIKFVNFRSTKFDTLNQKSKAAFQDFMHEFLQILYQIYEQNQLNQQQNLANDENNPISMKILGLYSSNNDFFESEDDQDCQFDMRLPRKRIHLNQ